MRREDMWKEALPALETYDRSRIFKVENTQNPVISPNNLPEGFPKVVEAIKASEAKRPKA